MITFYLIFNILSDFNVNATILYSQKKRNYCFFWFESEGIIYLNLYKLRSFVIGIG